MFGFRGRNNKFGSSNDVKIDQPVKNVQNRTTERRSGQLPNLCLNPMGTQLIENEDSWDCCILASIVHYTDSPFNVLREC